MKTLTSSNHLIRRVSFLIMGIGLFGSLRGQISPLSDQWLINPLLTNPAIAGTSRRAPLCVTARQQMHGMSGANLGIDFVEQKYRCKKATFQSQGVHQ